MKRQQNDAQTYETLFLIGAVVSHCSAMFVEFGPVALLLPRLNAYLYTVRFIFKILTVNKKMLHAHADDMFP